MGTTTETTAEAAAPGNARRPLPPEEARRILATWQAEHPDALFGAMSPNGIPTGIPESLAIPADQREDRSVLDLVVPEDSRAVTDGFVVALAHGISVTNVRMVSEPDQPVLVHYLDMREEFGVMLRMLVAGGSDRASALSPEELVTSRPRVAFMTKDEVATIVSIDQATSLMLGWGPGDMVGRRTLEFIHPDDHVRAIDNWMARRSHRSAIRGTVRLRYLRQDGTWLWVESSNDFVTRADGTTLVHTQMIDISNEMAASEALRRSEELLRRVTETVPIGLFHISSEGEVLFANPVLRRLVGEARPSTQSELCALLAPGRETELDDAILRVLDGGIESYIDLEMASATAGSRSSCQVTLRPVTDQDRTTGVLGCVVDVTELRLIADTDALTGLENRRSIMQILAEHLVSRDGWVAAVFVDLDHFKPVNDLYGHAVGDQMLSAVADRLKAGIRPGDRIGRLGGDEFLIICPGLRRQTDAMVVAERIREELAHPFTVDGRILQLGASIGVSCGRKGTTADDLVAVADAAMYRAKQVRGGRPVLLPARRGGPGGPPSARVAAC